MRDVGRGKATNKLRLLRLHYREKYSHYDLLAQHLNKTRE